MHTDTKIKLKTILREAQLINMYVCDRYEDSLNDHYVILVNQVK